MDQQPATNYSSSISRLFIGLIAITCITSIALALQTRYNAHPDEAVHLDAFCYFEQHWWPPALNSNGLLYSPDGWSRVYNGEVVYFLYGKLGTLIRSFGNRVGHLHIEFVKQTIDYQGNLLYLPLILTLKTDQCVSALHIYRLLNSFLLLLTLSLLFLVGRQHRLATWIGMLMLCTPQVIYIYSYANSDAWGLSSAVFLFLFALTQRNLLTSYPKLLALGGLTGLLLLSKEPFWISLLFSYSIIFWHGLEDYDRRVWVHGRLQSLKAIALVALIAVVLIAPWRIIYPLTQPGYSVAVEQMREARARADFKPSTPTNPGYRLASKGVSFTRLLTDRKWMDQSAQSFYGVFGYFMVLLPLWVYQLALAILGLNLFLTVRTLLQRRRIWVTADKVLYASAIVSMAVCVFASVYNSWTYDNQPQGRYLFSSIFPLGLLLCGPIDVESQQVRVVRMIGWMVLYGVSLYVLWHFGILNPVLK